MWQKWHVYLSKWHVTYETCHVCMMYVCHHILYVRRREGAIRMWLSPMRQLLTWCVPQHHHCILYDYNTQDLVSQHMIIQNLFSHNITTANNMIIQNILSHIKHHTCFIMQCLINVWYMYHTFIKHTCIMCPTTPPPPIMWLYTISCLISSIIHAPLYMYHCIIIYVSYMYREFIKHTCTMSPTTSPPPIIWLYRISFLISSIIHVSSYIYKTSSSHLVGLVYHFHFFQVVIL